MDKTFKIALGQMFIQEDSSNNLKLCKNYMEQASKENARLILFPEGITGISLNDDKYPVKVAQDIDGEFVEGLKQASLDYHLACAGTLFLRTDNPNKIANTHLLIDNGKILASYTKLHLYDAFNVRESDIMIKGNEISPIVEIDDFKFALMTCYDLRFPELARALTIEGAEVLLVASSWVRGPLKESHFEICNRSRALENTIYLCNCNECSSKNIGNSMVCDPMGSIIAQASWGNEIVYASLSKHRLHSNRISLPVLENRRFADPVLKEYKDLIEE